MNTKYISSRELKTYKFSHVLRTRENSDVFNSRDENIWFSPQKKQISSMYFIVDAMFIVVQKYECDVCNSKFDTSAELEDIHKCDT